MKLRPLILTVAIAGPALALLGVLVALGAINPGQMWTWVAFLASLVAGLGFLASMLGRDSAWKTARIAFVIQWLGLLASAAFLWSILFHHRFEYQYVASYSSKAMPGYYVYAAFWGGQEGTFLLWALLTATLGLILMRTRHALIPPAMFFLNLPLVLLTLVSVMRGPFLTFPAAQVPLDGQGLNPLLQDWWMTIHPPVLFTGFSSFVVPFAIAMAALVKRDYDGWVKLVLPWALLSTAVQATGFIMGGVWAYKVLGWGGYWGWDPVENGSLIPWLSNIALVHGLLVQRATGSLRRTNFFLAITSYVLVLYSSFLTRSGVLADFSVHSFANLGLSGFLLSFLGVIGVLGYSLLIYRVRDIPGPQQPLGNFSRESFMWLGQLVFMLMCALVTIGMSAPIYTKLFGPAGNVQTSFYNYANAPLAVAMGLLLGVAPLMRWRDHEPAALLKSALPSVVVAALVTLAAMVWGVRDIVPLLIVFAMAFALISNLVVTLRGFRSGWKHGVAYLGHMGVSILLIGVIASSGYGTHAQLQLPRGEERSALGYRLTFEGMRQGPEGKDLAMIAVNAPEKKFEASPNLYWSEYSQGYMKKPHIERFLTHDIYISPLEMVGERPDQGAVWFERGETKQVGAIKYTFQGFDAKMGEVVHVVANLVADVGGRTVPLKPVYEMRVGAGGGNPVRIPDNLPGGGSVTIRQVDAAGGRVALELPGGPEGPKFGDVLAVEVSTKPFINLVWLGAVVMLASAFLSVLRRVQDVARATAKPSRSQ